MASLVGQQLTVHKNDALGQPVMTWGGLVVAHDEDRITLEAEFNRSFYDLGLFVLEKGDLFRETYYFDRWWNVFEVRSPGGELRGWYCNITRPARLVGLDLYYNDLALDLLILPTGEVRLDDEDEFAALHLEEHDPQAFYAAQQAVTQIRTLLAEHRPPFQAISGGLRM